MTTRIGLAVSEDSVRAVAVRHGAVVWGAEVVANGRPLAQALDELFVSITSGGRLRRWPRPLVRAAIGPGRSQLRRLSGLPPVSDTRALTQLVSQSPARFFLRNGVPLVTTGVVRTGEDDGWGGAIEQPVVAMLEEACGAHRCRLSAVVPSLAIIRHALVGETLKWRDGEVCAELSLESGQIRASLRRTVDSAAAPLGEPPHTVPALSALGAEAWRFADAYGVAVQPLDDALAYRPPRAARLTRTPTWRIAIAGVACAAALITALLGPSLRAVRAARRASIELLALQADWRAAAAAESELALVTGALGEVSTFERKRHSATFLMTELTRALPNASALVAVRIDTAGGTLVALTPHAAPLLERLDRMTMIISPAIIGPITREVLAGAEVERVTVGFRWADASPPSDGSRGRR